MYRRYLDVFRAIDYFEEVMGTAWLKESLELLKDSSGGGGGFGRGIDLSSCAVSTPAYYWYRAREELALAVISGEGPGLYALKTAALGDDLMALQDSAGLLNRIEGLKSPAGAGNAIAELAIASGYARSGRPVVFTVNAGVFRVLGPEMHVLLIHRRHSPEDLNRGMEKTPCGTACGPEHQHANGLWVIYRYEQDGAIGIEGDQPDAGPDGTGCAGAGVPVVDCSFIARQGSRGPEIVRSGRVTGVVKNLPAACMYIPGEIIMPVRD